MQSTKQVSQRLVSRRVTATGVSVGALLALAAAAAPVAQAGVSPQHNETLVRA